MVRVSQAAASAGANDRNAAPAPLGVVAGSGDLPSAVAAAAVADGRPVHIFGFKGSAEAAIAAYPHTWLRLGQVGGLVGGLRAAGCHDVVIVGGIKRPDLGQLRLDLGGILALPTILKLTVGGDDSLLSRVVRFFEGKGFHVVGAHEVAPGLLAGDGPLGRHAPGADDVSDLIKARDVVAALGPFDVGQGAVVVRGHVLAVEAAEGTDRMLARCAELRQWGRGRSGRRHGVFYKGPKPGQEMRIDMPVIGPETVSRVAAAGLSGIAIAGGGVLLAEREATVAAADEAGVFIVGVTAADNPTSGNSGDGSSS